MKSESSQGGSLLKTGTVEEILELLGEESCEHRGKDRVEILEEICELETWDEQLTANILAAMK